MHLQLNRRRNNGKQEERNKETERKGKRENLILPTYSLTYKGTREEKERDTERERKREEREREEGRRGRNVFCDGASPFEDYFDFSAAAYTLSCWQL